MRISTALSAATIAAAATASGAAAKTTPVLEQTAARTGDRVGVRIAGAVHYAAPLTFYLVAAGMAEGGVCGQATPARAPIAVVGREGRQITVERFRFTVPDVAPGRYSIAMRFRGTATRRWACVIAPGSLPGRPPDSNVLRVRR